MIQDEIEQLINPIITDMGYELWGLEYFAQGKHSLLRIYIDKADGVDISDCEIVSKRISSILDVEDPIVNNYTLEISSPGIPRPLFKKSQYKRFIGETIQIKLQKPKNGRRKFIGKIIAANDTLLLDLGEEQCEFQFSNIIKANLMV